MKVAISTDGNFVSPHFGRCPVFTIVDIENGKIKNKEVVENPGHIKIGFIPQFLAEKNVECIVCGGMGPRAIELFKQLSIRTIIGVSGEVNDIIKKLLDGNLKEGESLCKPGSGKGYGIEKNSCEHAE